MRVLEEHVIDEARLGEVVALAYESQNDPVAFKNLVQLACASSDDGNVIKNLGFPLEGLDLSGVHFEDLDLTDLSLRGCNLSDAEFVECNMRGVALEGAVLRNTRFDLAEGALEGASVGDLSTFHSMRTNGSTVLADFDEAKDWFAGETSGPVRTVDPCPSALQLRHVLGKYIHPTGEPRRTSLNERAIVAGKRHIDDVQGLADSLVRHGYLHVSHRGRYERTGGDRYPELVAFVKDLTLSSGLRRVLNDQCDRDSCAHSAHPVPVR
jgi:hypothetical protein